MQHTKEFINDMYEYVKENMDCDFYDIYELQRLYNDIAEEFHLDIAFWVDGNYDWGDDEIYCYVYVDYVGSIVFDWSVKWYTDHKFYKDLVNYLLELEEQAMDIRKKILVTNKQ